MPKNICNFKVEIEHLRSSLGNSDLILEILDQVDVPLPFNFLSELTHLRKGQLYRLLVSLEKAGLIKKSTVTNSVFYSLRRQGK